MDTQPAVSSDRARWRGLGAASFSLVVLTLALPWLSFEVDCTSGIAPQSGAQLLIGTDVEIEEERDSTGPRDPVIGTVHVPPQLPVWLIVAVACGGISTFPLTGRSGWRWRRRLALAGMSAAALCVVWFESATYDYSGIGFNRYATDEGNPGAAAELGPFFAMYAFSLALLMNSTLAELSRDFESTKGLWRRTGLLSGYALAMPAFAAGAAFVGSLLTFAILALMG